MSPLSTTDEVQAWLRAQFNGRVVLPSDPGYDSARSSLLRRVRPPPGRRRTAGRRSRGGAYRPRRSRQRAAVGGAGRRPQPRRPQHRRRRDRPRPVRHAIDRYRRCRAYGVGWRRHDGRCVHRRRGDARSRHRLRRHRLGGHRRAHPGRRVGFLTRRYGLTIDSLLTAEVVTADGEPLVADLESHPDLFWAIRGGGGNFGVGTRLRFRLYEVPTVVGGLLVLPATADVIRSFVEMAQAAPEELTTIANIATAPPMPMLPADIHGSLVLMAQLCYAGDTDAGLRAVAPFRALTTPIVDAVRPMPYTGLFQGDGPPSRPTVVTRTMFVDTVGKEEAETIVDRLSTFDAPFRGAQIRVLGGAVSRVPTDVTAYAHRSSPIMVNVTAACGRPDDCAATQAWAAEFVDALRQRDTGAYVNFLEDEGAERVRDAYPPATWRRLVAVKRRYDPTNLFRSNHNIPPA